MAEAPAKEFSAASRELAEKIVGLTLKQAQELVDCLKEEHGIEPAGGGAIMMAAAGAGEYFLCHGNNLIFKKCPLSVVRCQL